MNTPTPRKSRKYKAVSLASVATLVLGVATAFAQSPSADELSALGFSPERLARVDSVMARYVAEGDVAGAVTLVLRHGRIAHLGSHGWADREREVPMTADAIFRIASMTKAVTSVAIMMLVEEGRLSLDDPVSRYIPGFRETTVAIPNDTSTGATPGYSVVPAARAITVRDLLTHTAGISYGTGVLARDYQEAGVYLWYFADKDEPIGEGIERLARLPFAAQPGERWVYGFSTDVLGYLIERVSGMSLADFFQRRIFDPLKMKDTHFYLPPGKADRLAAVYSASDSGAVRAPDEGLGQGAYVDGPRVSYSGGAGLLSTARDYARFLQMLLNGGELEGRRLLSPKTVELMTVNHVGDLYRNGDLGFGLGFEVVTDLGRAGRLGTVGAYGWGGAYYTLYWVDPVEGLVAVLMSQLLPSGGLDLQGKFRTLVYQAIADSN